MNIHRQRLLNVARALRESPDAGKFYMDSYMHPCGTPACALGHYAARRDLQDAFIVAPASHGVGDLTTASGGACYYDHESVCEHFGVSAPEAARLFSDKGCGGARDALSAAAFIETFAARRWPEPVTPPDWRVIAKSPLIPEHVRSEEATS